MEGKGKGTLSLCHHVGAAAGLGQDISFFSLLPALPLVLTFLSMSSAGVVDFSHRLHHGLFIFTLEAQVQL